MKNDILAAFPKTRPELPQEYKDIYEEHYAQNRQGVGVATSVASKLESWMHRQVARDLVESKKAASTLEIGAGTLNHIFYELPYISNYDVVEPFVGLYAGAKEKEFVRSFYLDISDISKGTQYERIISIATFEHVLNLTEVVECCHGLLAKDGVLRVAIPSEGTILWKLGYTLTTGVEFKRKYGLDYETLMRYEHVNTAQEIREVLGCFFKSQKISCLGLCPSLSLYQYVEVTK